MVAGARREVQIMHHVSGHPNVVELVARCCHCTTFFLVPRPALSQPPAATACVHLSYSMLFAALPRLAVGDGRCI